jgi:excisionase family DNA binding protein
LGGRKQVQSGQLFFTIKQLAERWQLNPFTVRNYIQEGKLTATKIGHGKNAPVRIHADDVAAFEVRQERRG